MIDKKAPLGSQMYHVPFSQPPDKSYSKVHVKESKDLTEKNMGLDWLADLCMKKLPIGRNVSMFLLFFFLNVKYVLK